MALLFADLERHVSCTRHLVKIKTVGELLIIVGPVSYDLGEGQDGEEKREDSQWVRTAAEKAVGRSTLDAVRLAISLQHSVRTFFSSLSI